jgi:hypothetical protein
MTQRDVGRGFFETDERIDYFIKHDTVQNFGDYLPEIFAKELLGYPRIDADMYRLIGSTIDDRWIRRDLRRINGHHDGLIAFWGCGKRGPEPMSPTVRQHCRFFGVRGPLTRDALGLPADTVLGDPGLLAPIFHAARRHDATTGRTICLPHIQDVRPVEELLAMAGTDLLVHPRIDSSEAGLHDILDRIASADFVLSASLHGAIIACAYGRPFAFWDNGHLDIPFKWQDFAGSIGITPRFATNLAEGYAIFSEQQHSISLPPFAPMLRDCPFTARPSAILRALAHDSGGPEGEMLAAAATAVLAAGMDQVSDRQDLTTISTERRTRRLAGTFWLKRSAGRFALSVKRRIWTVLGL